MSCNHRNFKCSCNPLLPKKDAVCACGRATRSDWEDGRIVCGHCRFAEDVLMPVVMSEARLAAMPVATEAIQ